MGSFISSITGLLPVTTYYFRAYATNSIGTGYGDLDSIRTLWNETVTVTDYNGNVYPTIQIGEQIWMQENLKVTQMSAASTYASRGIRVNAVAPGLVKSNMTRKLWETPVAESTSIAMHALGRLGEPADIASAIEWLLQPANNWITGQVIGIDGGLATLAPRK